MLGSTGLNGILQEIVSGLQGDSLRVEPLDIT